MCCYIVACNASISVNGSLVSSAYSAHTSVIVFTPSGVSLPTANGTLGTASPTMWLWFILWFDVVCGTSSRPQGISYASPSPTILLYVNVGLVAIC